jgi:copper chaperone NosL
MTEPRRLRPGPVDAGRRRTLRWLAALGLAGAAAVAPAALLRALAQDDAAGEDHARRSRRAAQPEGGPGPGPVQVGVDRCPYCSMAVIDARFAAQQVTVTGRVHVYDAIECLVDHVAGHGGPPLADGWCFVADHQASTRETARMIDVHAAVFLHHARIRTPMGGGLVALAGAEAAERYLAERGLPDALELSWDDLVERGATHPWVPVL